MRIPYRVSLFGSEWRIVWGKPSAWKRVKGTRFEGWKPSELDGRTVFNPATGLRLIILNPRLRRVSEVHRIRIFAHECLHAIELECQHRRVRGWRKHPISHAQIGKIDFGLAVLLLENVAAFQVAPYYVRRPRAAAKR